MPSFSPDGTKIAFISDRDGDLGEVYVMDADGQNQTNLTNNPTQDSGGDFSPDGSKIAFMRVDGDGSGWDIWAMDADGQNQTNVTNAASNEQAPRFSPDGTKIVFSNFDASGEVYVMDADGQNQTQPHQQRNVRWRHGLGSCGSPPETTIDSGPSGNTNDSTPSFGFSSSDSEASFECKVDSDDILRLQFAADHLATRGRLTYVLRTCQGLIRDP